MFDDSPLPPKSPDEPKSPQSEGTQQEPGTQPPEAPKEQKAPPTEQLKSEASQQALHPERQPVEQPLPGAETPRDSPPESSPNKRSIPAGVLVKEQIKADCLILVPENGEDERCYQPASYDLRLGSEYMTPKKGHWLEISRCDLNGMLTIEPFGTVIVSTYERVAIPRNVVGRFNLRIDHALEGLIVQMGTQVEPGYEGLLFALLHNISGQRKSLKYADYETRPFTIEFSYTSQAVPIGDLKPKKNPSLKDFIPPNYAREGIDSVIHRLESVQQDMSNISKDFSAKKMIWFTSVIFAAILITASLFIPFVLTKFSYDRDYFPLVSADAIAAMKYGPNHSNDDAIAKRVIEKLDQRSTNSLLVPRDQFFLERLAQLKARRDLVKNDPLRASELKSIQSQIDEITELLKK